MKTTKVGHPEGTKLVPFEGGWKVETIHEVGRWYKLPRTGKSLFCVTEIKDDTVYAYGFNYHGAWRDNCRFGEIAGDEVPASEEEVKQSLVAEAERRGEDLRKG